MDENSNRDENLKKRMANLTPWTKETAPHNGGRPKGSLTLVSVMKRIAASKASVQHEKLIKDEYSECKEDEKICRAHLYAARIDQAAMKGEEWALKFVASYQDGLPKQTIAHEGGMALTPLPPIPVESLTQEQIVAIRDIITKSGEEQCQPEQPKPSEE